MNKCYYRIVWENYPSDATPLNEHNLNKIDVSADEMDNRIISLDSTKFDKSEAQQLVKYIEYDENTGIFKITHYNGASYTIDTLLEKLAVNFDYDYQTQRLIIELSDGTVKYVDLSALITQYEFLESDTVHFIISADGKVKADVKEGSIQEKHLRPDYLADIKVEVAKAEASATAAEASKTAAAASATTAITKAGEASVSAQGAANSAATATEKATAAGNYATNAASSATSASNSATTAAEKADESAASATDAADSASTASDKANAASASANAAAGSATSADTYAKKAQSYAVGTGGVRPNEATDSAKYYYEQSKGISEGLSGVLQPMGTIAFSRLPSLADVASGWMYNISDQFTTTAEFREGDGHTVPSGANIYKTADGFWDVLAGTPVTGVKGNAESEYRKGNINLTPANIGSVAKSGDIMKGSLIVNIPQPSGDVIARKGLQVKKEDTNRSLCITASEIGAINDSGGAGNLILNPDGDASHGAVTVVSPLKVEGGLSVNNALSHGGANDAYFMCFNPYTTDDSGGIVKYKHRTTIGFAGQWHWQTGANNLFKFYKIRILSNEHGIAVNSMFSFNLEVYQSYQYWKVSISGYRYTSSDDLWYEPKAALIEATNRGEDGFRIVFGKDPDGVIWIAFPAMMYTGISICNLNLAYIDCYDFDPTAAFELVTESSISGKIVSDQYVYRPVKKNEFDELKNSVSDGKAQVASAITAKGSYVAATASFQTMANLINGLWQGEVRARIVDSFMVTVDAGQSYKRDGGLKTVPANKKMIEILLITVACEGNDAYIAPHITWTVGGTNPLCTGATVLGYNDFTHGSAYPCLMTYARRRIVESASQNETTLETSCNIYFGQTPNIVNKIMLSVSYLVFY